MPIPNNCNVIINNLHPMIYLFFKILEIELDKGLQSLFQSRDSTSAHTLKLLITITFFFLIKID